MSSDLYFVAERARHAFCIDRAYHFFRDDVTDGWQPNWDQPDRRMTRDDLVRLARHNTEAARAAGDRLDANRNLRLWDWALRKAEDERFQLVITSDPHGLKDDLGCTIENDPTAPRYWIRRGVFRTRQYRKRNPDWSKRQFEGIQAIVKALEAGPKLTYSFTPEQRRELLPGWVGALQESLAKEERPEMRSQLEARLVNADHELQFGYPLKGLPEVAELAPAGEALKIEALDSTMQMIGFDDSYLRLRVVTRLQRK